MSCWLSRFEETELGYPSHNVAGSCGGVLYLPLSQRELRGSKRLTYQPPQRRSGLPLSLALSAACIE
jgi:hypothetical protein